MIAFDELATTLGPSSNELFQRVAGIGLIISLALVILRACAHRLGRRLPRLVAGAQWTVTALLVTFAVAWFIIRLRLEQLGLHFYSFGQPNSFKLTGDVSMTIILIGLAGFFQMMGIRITLPQPTQPPYEPQ